MCALHGKGDLTQLFGSPQCIVTASLQPVLYNLALLKIGLVLFNRHAGSGQKSDEGALANIAGR